MSIPETINCEDACLKVKDKTYEDALERVKDEINRMGIKCYTSAVLNQLTSNFCPSCIVGHGGYGVVYQGKFPNTGEQVAIKKLKNKDIVEESETFMAEVRTMSSTNHRNLIKMKGYCFEPNTKALVYEFMENGSLDNILYKPDTSMKWEKLYQIAVEVAHGLMYLHEGSNEQIIHYDIKAGNVLLDNNHSPKIADFGLAKLIKRDVSGVPLSGKRGTNGYTAPELCTHRFSSIVTNKCDVYSFGMLLFEILGRRNINVQEEYFPGLVWFSFDHGQLEHLFDNILITKENRESANILTTVALLCIQYHPEDRPTMKEVWLMLDKEKQVQRKPLIPFPLWRRLTLSMKVMSNDQVTSGDFNGTSGSNERNAAAQDVPAQSQGDSHPTHCPEEITMKPSFHDLLSGSEMDDLDSAGREQSLPWWTGNSPHTTPTHGDPNSSISSHLPRVLEEPSSSFSEAGEDDPLPAIDGLQIFGEAFPGQELQACGYSINGTTCCNFEWVRYLEDGSVIKINGAKLPNYLVTADDVGTYLAVEVQPLDNRKRKGELVKLYANEQRKITCDSEMKEQIEKSLYSVQATYEVSLAAARYLDIWEPAILAVKREGYSIKCTGTRGEVVTEKFLPKTVVTISYEHPSEFSILGSAEQYLRAGNSSLRDTIVLTMRLFIMRAAENRKAKKKGISFREMLSILRH